MRPDYDDYIPRPNANPICEADGCESAAPWPQWPWCDQHRIERWSAEEGVG